MNVLIIGCGNIAKAHAKQLKKRGVKMDFYSRSIERAREYAAMFSNSDRAHSGDLRRVLAQKPWDGVWLCTPPSSHLDVIKMCIALKLKCFCEKPLVNTEHDAQELATLSPPESLLMIGENYFYRPVYYFIERVAKRLNLGAVKEVSLKKTFFQKKTSWRTDESPMIEGGVHYCAMALEIAGIADFETANLKATLENGLYRSHLRHDPHGVQLEVKYSWETKGATPAGVGQMSYVTFENGVIAFESNGLFARAKNRVSGQTSSGAFLSDLSGFGAMYDDVMQWLASPTATSRSTWPKALLALRLAGLGAEP